MEMLALSVKQIKAPTKKKFIDRDADSNRKEIALSQGFFCNCKMPLFRFKISQFFEQKNLHLHDFEKFRLTCLTYILVNILQNIFMVSIYIRSKKQTKKLQSCSLYFQTF